MLRYLIDFGRVSAFPVPKTREVRQKNYLFNNRRLIELFIFGAVENLVDIIFHSAILAVVRAFLTPVLLCADGPLFLVSRLMHCPFDWAPAGV